MRCLVLFIVSLSILAIPDRPTDPNHISSDFYPYELENKNFEIDGRRIDLYLPVATKEDQKFPVIVFGHGQAIRAIHYHDMFVHLAKKGFAVIHPMYDSGFFDTNWERMANDYNSLTTKVLNSYPDLNKENITYSGHSKGGHIALFAASVETPYPPKSTVVFAPAVFNQEVVERLPQEMRLSVVWGEEDRIIGRQVAQDIFDFASGQDKKLNIVKSYPDLEADHYFPQTKGTWFGGNNGLTAHHFFTVFPEITNFK